MRLALDRAGPHSAPTQEDEWHGGYEPRSPLAFRGRRGWLMRRLLLAGDCVGLTLSFLLTELISGNRAPDTLGVGVEAALFVLTLPIWVLGAKLFGLYDRDGERADPSTADDLTRVFLLATVGVFVVTRALALSQVAKPDLMKLTVFWALVIVCTTMARAAARSVGRRHPAYVQRTLIVGAGNVGQLIAHKLLLHREYGLSLLGFVDDRPRVLRADLGPLPVLGRVEELEEIVQAYEIDRAILAFPANECNELLRLVRLLRDAGVQVDVVPSLFEVVGARLDVHTVEGLALLGLPPVCMPRSSLLLKRAMDLTLSALALIALAPVFLAIAIAIKLDSPGPVFFRQSRMGHGDRVFRMLKFRTMELHADDFRQALAHLSKHAGSDERMFKIPDDPRVTRVGRVLRRFSIDELPQLFNVLRGEMSLVGPRPLILEEDRYVDGWERRRLDLKPGITGLWQVLGRDDIPFGEMVGLDYLYVTNWSLGGDLKLVLRTLPVVTRSRSV